LPFLTDNCCEVAEGTGLPPTNNARAMKFQDISEFDSVQMALPVVKPENSSEVACGAVGALPVSEGKAGVVPATFGLTPALLQFLSEDAPAGHWSHTKVQYIEPTWSADAPPFAKFNFGNGKKKAVFQVSQRRAGSKEATLRIARACCLLLDAGGTQEDVKHFQSECFSRASQPSMATVAPPVAPPNLQNGYSEKLATLMPPNLQNGSSAKLAALRRERSANERAAKVSHDAEPWTATERMIGKLELGHQKGQGLQDGEKPKRPRGRMRNVRFNPLSAVFDKLHAEGRFEGALQLEGRTQEKKNASVNGIYAALPELFGGSIAYEKVSDHDAEQRRVLYYHAEKKRWKVSESIGDNKAGFAFLKVRDGGKAPPISNESIAWTLFDGREGYNEDPAMRCIKLLDLLVQPGVATKLDAASLGASATDISAFAVSTDFAKGLAGNNSDSEESNSSSSSSARSLHVVAQFATRDASGEAINPVAQESGSESSTSSSTSGDRKRQRLSTDTPALPASDDGRKFKGLLNPPKERALAEAGGSRLLAAKMLVRSGLRCWCHHDYIRSCPEYQGH